MPKFFNWNEISPSELLYGAPKAAASHDGLSVPVQVVKNGQPYRFIHLGPVMRIPFGLKRKDSKYGTRFSCDMAFPGVCSDDNGEFVGNEEQIGYLKWLMAIDETNLNKAKEQATQWFKKEMPKEILQEFYFKNVMPSSQPQTYSPTFTTRIQAKGEDFVTKFYDKTGTQIDYDDVHAGSEVRPLIETSGLWFANKSFGMSFRVTQLMVLEDNRQFDGCAIPLPQPEGLDIPLLSGGSAAPGFNLSESYH